MIHAGRGDFFSSPGAVAAGPEVANTLRRQGNKRGVAPAVLFGSKPFRIPLGERSFVSENQGRNSHQKRRIKTLLFGGRPSRPCCFCRALLTPSTATLEHVVPLVHGGGWNKDNLRLSCESCNSERGSEDFETFQRRKRAPS